MSSPKPVHFPPKTERDGEKSSPLASLMAKKMQTLSFIHTELSPESCLGWTAGQCPHPGLGGDLFSFPSQQKEKRFLEFLTAPRAWSRLQPQPQQPSEVVFPSYSCTTQMHLLSLWQWDPVWEHFP